MILSHRESPGSVSLQGPSPRIRQIRTRKLFFEELERRVMLHADAAVDEPWLDHYMDDGAELDAAVLAGMPQPALLKSTALAAAPSAGAWSPLQTWPIEAIHTILLPTGKVLMWDRTFNLRLWDPITNIFTQPASPGYNVFCSGMAQLADGSLLVTGGHVVDAVGTPFAAIYNPFNDTWTQQANMNDGRWYPSTTTLANGDALVLSGFTNSNVADPLPQVYDYATGTWRDLTTALRTLSFYPRTFSAPNGDAFVAGPDPSSQYLDTSGTGQWIPVANRVQPNRSYGSAVMYAPGKILYVGGGAPSTNAAEVIDLNLPNPTWRAVSPMTFARRNCNATLLPDGEVLVTGGNSGSSNYDGDAIMTPEIWNPQTETFTKLADMSDIRWYHSTALLLPDGRVLSAGGDVHLTGEIFTPPYLQEGIAQPTISSAPGTVQYGDTFFVGTPDAADITSARWIRLGSATHAQNWDQYIQPATITSTANGLLVSAPTTPNASPPGYYMLFLNKGDVPSVGQIIHVGTTLPALSVPDVSVTEGSPSNPATALFTVKLAASSGNTVTVNYATADGSALAGTNYTTQTGTLTFPPGATTQTVAVPILNDGVFNPDATFKLNLSNPVGAGLSRPQGQALIRDAGSLPVLQIQGTSLVEGNSGTTNALFKVNLSAASATPITVNYNTADGTAKATSDYLAQSGTLTFAPGVTQLSIAVPVVGNTMDEINKTFSVQFSSPQGATLDLSPAQCLIYSDDAPPLANLMNGVTIAEPTSGSMTITITATLSAPSGKTVILPWNTNAGTATAGINYIEQVGQVVFQPGVTSQTFTITVLNDGMKTPLRQFTIFEQNEVVNALYGNRTTLITITNSDALPAIMLSNASVTEGNAGTTSAVFTATLSGTFNQIVSVNYSTSAGTATADSDYVESTGTLTFPIGTTSQTISIPVNGDALAESAETFNLLLNNPVNAVFSNASAVGTILNDDGAATPTAPQNVTTVAGYGSAKISWKGVSGATSYKLYRGRSSNGEGTTPLASNIVATQYIDTMLANGSKYYYWVTAVKNGVEGPASAGVMVTPTAYNFPTFISSRPLFTLNGYDVQDLYIPNNSLQLTDGGTNQSDSAFLTLPLNISSFNTQFSFEQLPSFNYTGPLAEGITFTLQSLGPTSLGSSGGGLGYAGIAQSAAIKFDLNDNAGEGTSSTGLYLGGASPTVLNSVSLAGSGIDLQSGHRFNVSMTYDGTTLIVIIADSITLAVASQSYTVDLPTILGSTQAYVGFTGSTGSKSALQRIDSWVLNPAPLAPSMLAVTSATNAQVSLSWINIDPNTMGLIVERKTGAAGTYGQIATITGNITNSYVDSTVSPGTTYYYRVRSTTQGVNSAPSNETSVTTGLNGPSTDLQITLTDGQTSLLQGALVSYTIVATNAGPSNVSAASLSDIFPSILTGVTFSAIAAGGATGFTATGTGNIADSVTMPVGSSITYTAYGIVSATAAGSLANTANIATPPGVTEINVVNNTATETDTIAATLPAVNYPSGFAGAAGRFAINGAGATIAGSNLQITDGGTNEATSTYFNTRVDITKFTANFTIQQTSGTSTTADGMTFVIQNAGLAQTGRSGGGLGYNSIPTSMAIKFDLFSNLGEGSNSTGLLTNGAARSSFDLTGTGIDLHSTHPLNVSLSYDGTTLAVTLVDSITQALARQFYAVNIPSLTGNNLAYVGFTGGTGGLTAVQKVLNWTFNTVAPTTDLQVSLTDGQSSVVQGSPLTYTLVVTNNGPSSVVGASVADVFPAILSSITFTSVATGGATGFTASGAGNIADTVTMPIGSTITYTINATLSPTATGTLVNTASVAVPANVIDVNTTNNSTSDSDTITIPTTDLQISLTDGQTSVVQGSPLTYTLVVTNNGPSSVVGASVADAFPAILSGITFTSVATGGATGFTASGAGNIADTVTMPIGSIITYTINATLSPTASGTLVNTASVTVPANVIDVNTTNNSASDSDTIAPILNFANGFANMASQFAFVGSSAGINGSILWLTSGLVKEGDAAWALTRVNVTRFATQFAIQQLPGTKTTADGMTFTIQNNGLASIGDVGGGLGYNGIKKSVAIKFDLFSNSGEGPNSTGLLVNGKLQTTIDLTSSGVDLHSTHRFNVGMNYDGSTLQVTITDAITQASASQSYAVNIPTLIGSNTAWAGFTGGTGTLTAVQSVANWTFTQTAPPLAATALKAASVAKPSAAATSMTAPKAATPAPNDSALLAVLADIAKATITIALPISTPITSANKNLPVSPTALMAVTKDSTASATSVFKTTPASSSLTSALVKAPAKKPKT